MEPVPYRSREEGSRVRDLDVVIRRLRGIDSALETKAVEELREFETV